ncbi:MAG TPA: hypothetical protein PLH33_08395, partial [Chitinophagaceae bacterium]|nr:hypothetical protein [Chitinophagaceae bacterium]
MKVRITDWFIFKDKAVIKYVGLEDAVIKLQRKDSIWNYQFIVDHFSSPTKSTSTKSNKDGFALNLKKIDFKNIRFVNNDRWTGEQIDVKLGSFVVDADNIDFNKGSLILNSIIIDKPVVIIDNYTALRPPKLKKPRKEDSISRLNPADMFVKVTNLKINSGTFISNANQDKPTLHFDGEHIAFNKINGSFNNVLLQKDTITASIEINCNERSGLVVKQLNAKYKVTPQIMEFANLSLETNKSKLGNYYAMKFNRFNNDFGNYISKVVMVADFRQSNVHSNDIAFFAPALSHINKNIQIGGKYKGTVSDFNITHLFAKAGSSIITGNLSMKGLPDFEKTFISLNNGAVYTTANDLLQYIPILKSYTNPNIPALGNIVYKGSFNGHYNNFISNGNL